MQVLPPRQRAVLVLRDVLEFSAAEVAAQLDTSVAAVNSALQRARAAARRSRAATRTRCSEPDDPAVRRSVDRYVRAFEAADVDALVALLTDDAVLEMPPVPLWYGGRVDYGRFIARVFAMRGTGWRMVPDRGERPARRWRPTAATTGAPSRLHTLQVLTVTAAGIAHNVVFQDPQVFAAFDLDLVLQRGPLTAPGTAVGHGPSVLSVGTGTMHRLDRGEGLSTMIAPVALSEEDLVAARAELAAGRPFTVWFTPAAVGVPANGSARVISIDDVAEGDFIQVRPAGSRDALFCSPSELTRTRPPRKQAKKQPDPAPGPVAPAESAPRPPAPLPEKSAPPKPAPRNLRRSPRRFRRRRRTARGPAAPVRPRDRRR